jgi:hypothetical protein
MLRRPSLCRASCPAFGSTVALGSHSAALLDSCRFARVLCPCTGFDPRRSTQAPFAPSLRQMGSADSTPTSPDLFPVRSATCGRGGPPRAQDLVRSFAFEKGARVCGVGEDGERGARCGLGERWHLHASASCRLGEGRQRTTHVCACRCERAAFGRSWLAGGCCSTGRDRGRRLAFHDRLPTTQLPLAHLRFPLLVLGQRISRCRRVPTSFSCV